MAHHRGPKTTTQDLIFYYDTGNEKSFAGEPTTNLATNTPLYGGWPSSYALIDSATKTFDFTTSSVEWGGPAAWTTFYYNVSDYTGQYVTISAVVESFDETSGVFSFMWIGQTVDDQVYLGYSPEEDRNTKTTKTPERISWSGVIGTGGKVGITIWMNNGDGGQSGGVKVRFSNIQVEVKPHPTPFVNGTRSVTQGLIDLTRNETINLSSVSFDSNAQMSFDGTDDFIDTNFSPTSINNSTIEAVVYRNTATGRYEAIIQNNLDSDDALYVFPNGTLGFWPCAGSSLSVPTGQWSYVAVSYNGTTLTFCVNGTIQVVTTTCADIMDWDFLRIGAAGSGDGERWIGKIAIAKVYNRALTSSELYQNYNAIKTRFGI